MHWLRNHRKLVEQRHASWVVQALLRDDFPVTTRLEERRFGRAQRKDYEDSGTPNADVDQPTEREFYPERPTLV